MSITDDRGWVYMVRKPPQPDQVVWRPRTYQFECRLGVCMALIHPEDAPSIRRKLRGCCGNRKKVYFDATQQEIDKWKGPGPDPRQ